MGFPFYLAKIFFRIAIDILRESTTPLNDLPQQLDELEDRFLYLSDTVSRQAARKQQ